MFTSTMKLHTNKQVLDRIAKYAEILQGAAEETNPEDSESVKHFLVELGLEIEGFQKYETHLTLNEHFKARGL